MGYASPACSSSAFAPGGYSLTSTDVGWDASYPDDGEETSTRAEGSASGYAFAYPFARFTTLTGETEVEVEAVATGKVARAKPAETLILPPLFLPR